jgi:hypothetical protein
MRNRFHEPRSDPPSPRRFDDVNANKSQYGNKRETPSIRCHETSRRPRTASRTAHLQNPCTRHPCAGIGAPGSVPGDGATGSVPGSVHPGSVRRDPCAGRQATGSLAVAWRDVRDTRCWWDSWTAAARVRQQLGRDLGIVPDDRGRASRTDPGLAGHVRLAGNVAHRNPSASDIHPRNRTPARYVSLGTDDAIQDHRTGPGAIPRNKEGKDGC